MGTPPALVLRTELKSAAEHHVKHMLHALGMNSSCSIACPIMPLRRTSRCHSSRRAKQAGHPGITHHRRRTCDVVHVRAQQPASPHMECACTAATTSSSGMTGCSIHTSHVIEIHMWGCRMAGLQQEVASAKQALLAASGPLPPPAPSQGHSASFWLATGVVAILACAGPPLRLAVHARGAACYLGPWSNQG